MKRPNIQEPYIDQHSRIELVQQILDDLAGDSNANIRHVMPRGNMQEPEILLILEMSKLQLLLMVSRMQTFHTMWCTSPRKSSLLMTFMAATAAISSPSSGSSSPGTPTPHPHLQPPQAPPHAIPTITGTTPCGLSQG